MKLIPLDDRIVIKQLDAESKTAGGIILPDTAKEKPQIGKVIAVGPGAMNEKSERQALQIKVGDTVLYSKYSGTEIKTGGRELLIIAEKDVLAIIEE